MKKFEKATTPEARIAEFLGVDTLSAVSVQRLNRAFVVNTKDMRIDFDKEGNFVSLAYVGDDTDKMVDPYDFDWDSLDH